MQASPHDLGDLVLRFARVKRYRPDERADQTDTIATAGHRRADARGYTPFALSRQPPPPPPR